MGHDGGCNPVENAFGVKITGCPIACRWQAQRWKFWRWTQEQRNA